MNGKLSWAMFWALVGIFVVIASVFFIPTFRELLMGFLFLIISGVVFLLLGAALIVLTVKEKVGGTLKKFLILTGASAAGFFGLIESALRRSIHAALFLHHPFLMVWSLAFLPPL